MRWVRDGGRTGRPDPILQRVLGRTKRRKVGGYSVATGNLEASKTAVFVAAAVATKEEVS